MPRAHGLGIHQGVFHVTHRCHNRQHLLKFARDRDAYRSKLRDALQEFEVALLDYCLTSNHVHLLVDVADRSQLSHLMRKVAGETARAYNRRKARMNAFWGDAYHATCVQDGTYLWRCLVYLELNMVRCGVVKHPAEWQWVGYHEIMGRRQRYRLLDLERLCWRLATDSIQEVRGNLDRVLSQRIAEHRLERESCWTQSLAVGDRLFLMRAEPLVVSRRETRIVEAAPQVWALQEAAPAYGGEPRGKKGAKTQ
jgi:putative transposase